MQGHAERRFYRFGRFRLDATGRVLSCGDRTISLPPKAAGTLLLLIQNAGNVVEKEELLKHVWPDAFVEEGSLTRTISMLRKVLEDGAQGHEFISTIAKRGYRFAAKVEVESASASPSPVSPLSPVLAPRIMLAVLPFQNLSGNPEQEYFSDGLTEEMITQLARLSPERLGIIARTSAMQYKSTSKTIEQIGAELGVSYVLEGSVRRVGNRVRISAQLIRASDALHAWAESYERNLDDILALQADVARAIAQEIQIKLTTGERKRLELDKARSIDPQAHELYLRGRHFQNQRTEEGMKRSIECFEQALKHDSAFAAAYDGIADAYTMLACRGIMPAAKAFHVAKTAARQAVRIDPELGEGFASLAHVRLHDWDWVGLDEEFQRALELDPGHAIAHYWYAEYLMAMGRADEAVARVKQAQRMDPVNPLFNASVGMILYLAHNYDSAISGLRQALEFEPSHFLLHFRLGLVYAQKRLGNEAIASMQRAVSLSGRSTETLTGLAHAYAAAGKKTAMREILDELTQPRKPYVSRYDVARVHGLLADKSRAFEWLQQAYEEHSPDLIELKCEPCFDSLHADPRFRELTRLIGWVD
jgi:TolB-like protein/Tfp pilus assembly protein PilF